jgi:hypothetical protein
VILVANSLVRNRDLYGELSAGYVLSLYVGGTIGLVMESFVRAIAFYALFGRRVEAAFGTFFLGIVVFGCLTIIAALLNLAVPIVVTIRVAGVYSSYSVLSLHYFLGLEGQTVLLRATVALLDVLVISQLAAHSFFVSWVARVSFWKVFLAAAIIDLAIHIVGWSYHQKVWT